MYWNKQVAINYWIDKDYYQVERSFDLSRVVFKLIVSRVFFSCRSSLFLSLSLFPDLLYSWKQRNELSPSVWSFHSRGNDWHKLFDACLLRVCRITKLSNFIIHPRAFVLLVRLWTGQSIEHGSGKRRNVGTFSSIDILCRHRRRMDSISFLINQFHCDIFEGSYPRREFKSVKDISFDAGEIDGKGIGRMIYGNDFSTCLFLIYYTREMCSLQYRISLGDLWKEMKFKLRYFRL